MNVRISVFSAFLAQYFDNILHSFQIPVLIFANMCRSSAVLPLTMLLALLLFVIPAVLPLFLISHKLQMELSIKHQKEEMESETLIIPLSAAKSLHAGSEIYWNSSKYDVVHAEKIDNRWILTVINDHKEKQLELSMKNQLGAKSGAQLSGVYFLFYEPPGKVIPKPLPYIYTADSMFCVPLSAGIFNQVFSPPEFSRG